MISLIKGKIININNDSIVVLTNSGVGYEVKILRSKVMSLEVGKEIEIHTYLKVSENALELYGFDNDEQREFFMLVLSVSGIGPKSAMNVLSLGSIDEIKSAIARADVEYLTAVQGMGKKTAERMVVELKSKIKRSESQKAGDGDKYGEILGEVIDGLIALGYSKEEAREAVRGVNVGSKTTEEVLREVLSNK